MKFYDENDKKLDATLANRFAAILKKQGDHEGAQAIQDEIDNYAQQKISVAVMGLHKRGKSTFCNAFLGRNDDLLAPVDRLPATSMVSKFCYDKSRQDAEVVFLSGEKKVINYSAIKDYVMEEFNPENKKNVDNITIYGNFDIDEDVSLLDMPGDDSIHACHTAVVYKYLPQADVVVFLSSADDPIKHNELQLLKKIKSNDLKKIFFAINKIDASDENEIEDAEAHNRQTITNAGISIENKIYRISAKNAMSGNLAASGMNDMMGDIKSFLTTNKVKLLRASFWGKILNIARPTIGNMEMAVNTHDMKLEDLEAALPVLKATSNSMTEESEKVVMEFLSKWKTMIEEFDHELPLAEERVNSKVTVLINEIPMLSINKKTLNELPERISNIVEEEMRKPCEFFETQVRENIKYLDANFPSVSKFLADENYRVKFETNLKGGIGSLIGGGLLVGLGSILTTIAGGLSSISIPVIGSVFAVLSLPIVAVGILATTGGGLFLALPVFGWIHGKNRQKKELLANALSAINNAFREIKLTKLPYLEHQGTKLVDELKARLHKETTSVQIQLKNAIVAKKDIAGNSKYIDELKQDLDLIKELSNEISEAVA